MKLKKQSGMTLSYGSKPYVGSPTEVGKNIESQPLRGCDSRMFSMIIGATKEILNYKRYALVI